jgi:YegS/Rv2252/BmrU family lipid kinase
VNASESVRLVVIANPAAGKGSALRRLAPVCERLERLGVRVETRLTERSGHATSLARAAADDGAPIVAAFGGDGTAREVASGLVGSETMLGLLPFGSGNDLARSLGIPTSLDVASDVLTNGVPLAIDIGEDASGFFTGVCGIGFAAEVAHEANATRLFTGSAAYFAGVFTALMRLKPVAVTITLDDEVVRTNAVFVMAQNTPYCGGGQLMAPDATLTDGKLDVVVVREIGRLDLVRTFPKVYSGRHVTHPAFDVYRSESVRVESAVPLLKILDGDVVGTEPMNATTRHAAIRVLVPKNA